MTAIFKDTPRLIRGSYEAPEHEFPELLSWASKRSGMPLGEWAKYGNCAGINPDRFLACRPEYEAAAKAVCQSCVVVGECIDFALEADLSLLVLAGLSPEERRHIVDETVSSPFSALDELRFALEETPTALVAAE